MLSCAIIAAKVPRSESSNIPDIKCDWLRQKLITKHPSEFVIIAKLMLVNLSHAYNRTHLDEYRQILKHRFAIVWTKTSVYAQSEYAPRFLTSHICIIE